jgi:hypothetical protein
MTLYQTYVNTLFENKLKKELLPPGDADLPS